MTQTAAIVLLAAGESKRYGGVKQLALIDGEPMVRRSARTALATNVPVIVVTGAYAAQVEAVLDDLPLRIVRNDGWQQGMGSSLASGIRHLQAALPQASAALLCLADQPLIETVMLMRMLKRHGIAPERILATEQGGGLGPPALFPHDCFDTLTAWSGSRGAQALLQREVRRVERFVFDATTDIDTPADLQKLHKRLR